MARNTAWNATQCGKLPLLRVKAKFQILLPIRSKNAKNAKLGNDNFHCKRFLKNVKFGLIGSASKNWPITILGGQKRDPK